MSIEPENITPLLGKKLALEGASNGLEILAIIGAVIVAIGVIWEAVVSVRTFYHARELHAVNTSIDTLRRKEIAALEEASHTAEARANQLAIELEKLKKPRSLTQDQQTELGHKLSGFPIGRVLVGTSPSTFEGEVLAEQIVNSLMLAKLNASANDAVARGPLGGIANGVVIRTTSVPKNVRAAVAAAAYLNSIGVETAVEDWDKSFKLDVSKKDGPDDFALLIIVGNKPMVFDTSK